MTPYIFTALISIFFLYLFNISFRLSNNVFFGKYSHPLAGFFLLNSFVMMLPGVLLIGFMKSERLKEFNYNLAIVSHEVRVEILFFYLYSLIVLVGVFLFLTRLLKVPSFKKIFKLNNNAKSLVECYSGGIWFLIIIQIFSLIAMFHTVGLENIPLYNLIAGDYFQANVNKALILTGVIDVKIKYISNFVRFVFLFSPLFVFNLMINGGGGRMMKLQFLLSFIFTSIFLLYDGQKSPVFFYAIAMMFMYIYYKGLSLKVALLSFVLIIPIYYLYLYSFGLDKSLDSLALFFNRAILGQSQGLYFIQYYIEPELKYLIDGIPFASRFIQFPERADALVMKIIYGSSDINVNMNTYFLGEAYSSLGRLGYFLSPFIVSLSLYFMVFFYTFAAKRNFLIFFPMIYVFLYFFVPINQRFNVFLYFKDFILMALYSMLIYFILTFFKKIKFTIKASL